MNDPLQRRYAYTDAGRLATFTDTARGVTATYSYDAHGQRTGSVVTQGSTTTTTTFAYEGLTLLRADTLRSAGAWASAASVTYLTDGAGRPYAGIYELELTRFR